MRSGAGHRQPRELPRAARAESRRARPTPRGSPASRGAAAAPRGARRRGAAGRRRRRRRRDPVVWRRRSPRRATPARTGCSQAVRSSQASRHGDGRGAPTPAPTAGHPARRPRRRGHAATSTPRPRSTPPSAASADAPRRTAAAADAAGRRRLRRATARRHGDGRRYDGRGVRRAAAPATPTPAQRHGADPVRHAYYPGRRMNLGVVLLPLRDLPRLHLHLRRHGQALRPRLLRRRRARLDGDVAAAPCTPGPSPSRCATSRSRTRSAPASTVAFLQVIVGVLTVLGLLAAGRRRASARCCPPRCS